MSWGWNPIEFSIDEFSVKKEVFVDKYEKSKFTDNFSTLYNSINPLISDDNTEHQLFYIIRE